MERRLRRRQPAPTATVRLVEVGGRRYQTVGGVHRIPLPEVDGALYLCGLEAVGPDPEALLAHLGAGRLVCLQTDEELDRRYPDYRDWLGSAPHAVRLSIEDHLTAPDSAMVDLVTALVAALAAGEGVVVHCGAGWGRAGLAAALVLTAFGWDVDQSLHDLRAARPAAGPQSTAQDEQLIRLAPLVRAVGD